MKLSFSTLGCPNYNVDQIISMATGNGYAGVELRAVEGTVDLWTLDAFRGAGLAETAKKFHDQGIVIACIGTNIRFVTADEAEKQHHLETAKRYIEIANALGCPYLRTFGGPLVLTQGYLESIEWIQDGYEALCDLTKGAGIMPLLETHDDFSTAPRVLDIISGVSSENIGVIWDILHPLRHGEAIPDTYRRLKEWIHHVHIKDSSKFDAKGFDLVLTGTGQVPLGQCLQLLEEGGYKDYLSFEWEKMWHPEIEEPEIAIPHYAKAIQPYLK